MRRYLLLCGRVATIAGFLGFLSVGAGGCAKLESRDLIREGNALYKASEYERAIEKYDASLELEPDGVTVLWNRACAAEAIVLNLRNSPEDERLQHYADIALRDFQAWYERLDEEAKRRIIAEQDDAPEADEDGEAGQEGEDPDKPKKTVEQLVEDHRLVILDAAGRCDDLINHWLQEHNDDPDDELLYLKVAQQYDRCDQPKQATQWYVKRTEDFPGSAKAHLALAQRKFEPLTPEIDSGLAFNESIPPAERIALADEVLAVLDKAVEADPKMVSLYIWRNMAYTQRQLARIVVDEPELPEERLEVILAREDSLLGWKSQRARCDLLEIPECPPEDEEQPQTECCPRRPFTPEEVAADAEAKAEILAEIEAAKNPENDRRKRRKRRGKRRR